MKIDAFPQPAGSAEPGALGRLFTRPRMTAALAIVAALALAALPGLGLAQGFDKVEETVNNVYAILVTISVVVVSIAVAWAGFKMIFQGARLADVANVLIGGTLVGGSAAFAAYIVS